MYVAFNIMYMRLKKPNEFLLNILDLSTPSIKAERVWTHSCSFDGTGNNEFRILWFESKLNNIDSKTGEILASAKIHIAETPCSVLTN